MPGSSTFTNRIRVGKDVGIPTQDTRGEVGLIKMVVVTAASQLVSAKLPDNAALISPPYFVMASAFAISAGVRLSLGVPGNINKYAQLTGLNAVQATVMNVSAANIRSVGGDIVITVSAVSGATSAAGGGNLYIPYIITQDAG
jgi:ABC-type transporter Mla maintaining outer membrane lipid asymmetry permease subunit MlaE